MNITDVITAPWAIMPDKLLEIQAVYASHLRGEKIDIASIEARIGKPLSEETKRRISEAKRGITTRGYGWKHSEETKMKMKQSQAYLKWVAEGNTPLPAEEQQ